MRRTPRLLPLAVAAVVTVGGLSGCSSDEGDASDRLQVVTSIYPLQFLAERVGGEHVEVTTLASSGGAHDFELTISQTAALADADVALYLEGFESAVDEAVEQNGPDRVLDVGPAADLLAAGETEEEHAEHADEEEHSDGDEHTDEDEDAHTDEDEDAHTDEDGDEHADEDEHTDEAGDGHDHGDEDPHFWLDPERMSAVAEAITAELTEVAPDRSEDFDANLAELQDELAELDRSFEDGLAACELSTVVVSHDAFGYLEKYGLEFAPIAGLSPDAEPSPQHIAALQDLIRDTGVTTVFSERLASPAMAETLAADLGLETAVLDPVEGLSDETADEDYLSLMEQNLAALQQANRCR